MGFINLDYYKTIRQANKLDNAAEQCEDAEMAANKAYAEICENWSGEAAEAFKVKLEEWKRETNRLKEECRALAQTIKTIATEIKEADEAAANAIQR